MNKPTLNKNIFGLGANSFFTDFSTEMILPLLPIFLERFLHATKTQIGLIEGLAELSVALLIALSGFYSDRLGRRKGIVVFGYGLSNLIKPLAFFAQSATMIMTIRIGDRLAKGIRVAPRDALISASTPKGSSGFVFGFHKMMDGAGALVGSLSAFGLLWWLGESEDTFRTIFALSIIPGIISMLILVFIITDVPFTPTPMKRFRPSALPVQFYFLVAFQTLFSLFAMNYSFMILKAGDNGLALAVIPLAYTLYNLTQALFAIPIGKLADKLGKAALLSFVYLAFGLGAMAMATGSVLGVWIGFGIYGFFAGGFNSLAKAIISDTAPHDLKATAYGVYYTSVGLATLLSLSAAGWMWDSYGSTLLFVIASSSAVVLSVALFVMRNRLAHP
ncbi:MAG: MFS transporter [Sulfurimonas sp.]|uniref:MFS transporter n=1 Tax=Sulfurimonas sp. TaxID=2022749 RepID=UPI00262D6B20|nr:MFS transporter [Sulfurimonas sp.]MDD2653416.1 MFS transporter [Sulfurimonas sp.]MDD3451597.1 MFS transporter [Sulfurimonas sp.]